MPCGECDYCQRGWQTVCPTQKAVGYHWDGGLAQYIVIPEEVLKVDGLNRIEDHVSFAEASVAEPFACALNAQELAGVGDGDVVAVVGAGPIGCIHVRLARARGAREVFLIELSRERLDLSAERVKPDEAICSAEVDPVAEVMRLTEGRGVDVIITAAGSGKAQEDALQMAALRGPDQPLRWAAEGQADDHLRLERGALPRVDRGRAPTARARRRTGGPCSTSPRGRCRSRT